MNKVFVATAVFSKITKKKQQQTFPQETCKVKHFALKNHSSFCFCPSRIIGAGKKCGASFWGPQQPLRQTRFFKPFHWRVLPILRGPKSACASAMTYLPESASVDTSGGGVNFAKGSQGKGGGCSSRIDDLGKSVFETVSPWFLVFWFRIAEFNSCWEVMNIFFAPEK